MHIPTCRHTILKNLGWKLTHSMFHRHSRYFSASGKDVSLVKQSKLRCFQVPPSYTSKIIVRRQGQGRWLSRWRCWRPSLNLHGIPHRGRRQLKAASYSPTLHTHTHTPYTHLTHTHMHTTQNQASKQAVQLEKIDRGKSLWTESRTPFFSSRFLWFSKLKRYMNYCRWQL